MNQCENDNVKSRITIIGCGYFSQELRKRGINNPNVMKNKFLRFIYYRLYRHGIKYFLSKMINKKSVQSSINSDYIILFDSFISSEFIIELSSYIEHIVTNKTKLIFYYWNTIRDDKITHERLSERWEVWSFDYNDCDKYGLKFANTFYFPELATNLGSSIKDCFFIGRNKGRRDILTNINYSFIKAGLSPDIVIVEGNVIKRKKNQIPYYSVLRRIENSKSIVDIVQSKQTGLTLRSLESVFFKKKLITNNTYIKKIHFIKKRTSSLQRMDNWNLLN